MGTKLYVGNLSYNTTEDSLRTAFSANGREVASVSIIMDRETGRSRGFAFVEMASDDAARQALQELDGQNLDGRMLRINEAREREARGPRTFGGPPRPGGPGFGPRPGEGGPPGDGGFVSRPPADRPTGAARFGPPAAPGGGRKKGGDRDRDRGGGGEDRKKKRRNDDDGGW